MTPNKTTGNSNSEEYYDTTHTVHNQEPEYTRPLLKIPSKTRQRMHDRLRFLYGKTIAKDYMPELERILKVYYAHKPLSMGEKEEKFDPTERFTEKDVVLITYGDLFRSKDRTPLGLLAEMCDTYLRGVINTLHILPFFPYSSDKGFSIIDFETVDPRLGSWQDIEDLEGRYQLMFDGVINHVSSKSRWFQEFLDGNPYYKNFFISYPGLFISPKKKSLPILHNLLNLWYMKSQFIKGDPMKTFQENLHCQKDINQNYLSQMSLPIKVAGRSVCRKKVEIDFNGGNVTSDAGVLLLSEVEHQIGLIDSLAGCIEDSRRSYSVEHSIKDLVAQRVYQIACGYEDANDSNSLRKDPVLKMALDRLPVEGDDLGTQPTMSRLENQVTDKELEKMKDIFIQEFIASYDKAPKLIVLEFDDTNHTVYGHQQQSLFNGYYDEYCFMPVHVYEGISGKFITAKLRPGKRSSGKETVELLKSIVKKIRLHWTDTVIVFRGDGHFSSPELFEYINSQENMFSITGLTSNKKLKRDAQVTIDSAKRLYKETGQNVKLYHAFSYKAVSWSESRKVVVKVEINDKGLNVRFISTDMEHAKAKYLYENIYCARGNMELMIKEHKTYTKSDRSSCHRFKANQLRLLLHSAAYVLLHYLRTQALKGTELSKATFETLRLKLLKIGGRIVELKTKIKIHLPDAFPYKHLLKKCFDIFSHLRQTEIIRLC